MKLRYFVLPRFREIDAINDVIETVGLLILHSENKILSKTLCTVRLLHSI